MIATHNMDQISETQLTFTCSKSAIETVEKDGICSKLTIKIPKSH